jgi:hypothetical protein
MKEIAKHSSENAREIGHHVGASPFHRICVQRALRIRVMDVQSQYRLERFNSEAPARTPAESLH